MRSLLFVPGNSERKLEKGFGAGADVVIVDLEDSVAPQNKALAREIAARFIAGHRTQTGSAIYVRVNDLSTGQTDDDLAALVSARPDGIMLPKSNSGQDVQHLSAKLRVHEAENGLADGAIKILPIITETPAGVLAAATYAGASARLAGLTWGAEDLSAALGARAARDERGRYTDVFRQLARRPSLRPPPRKSRRSTPSFRIFATWPPSKRNVPRRSAMASPARWRSTPIRCPSSTPPSRLRPRR